jgi:hypothetical protein
MTGSWHKHTTGNGEYQDVGGAATLVGGPAHASSVDDIFVHEIVSKRSPDERSDIRDPFVPHLASLMRATYYALIQQLVSNHRTPVPPHLWHFTTLSPFFTNPLPSQFLHFCFFLTLGPFSLAMSFSRR